MLKEPVVESKPIEISAEELALRCQEGCLESFEQLVGQFEQRIVNFLNKMVNSRQDAEDLTQDTFVKAYKNIHRFNPKYKFTTWLFTIAKRMAMNHYRSVKTTVELTSEKEIDERDPSVALEEKDQAEGLWDKAKRLLKPNQYDALWLRYGEGFSIREAAKVMQTNELRVRVLLHRARNKLAKHLTGNQIQQ
ncbi:MAG: ECF RNA polymerase sigma factor SigW [Verrucomicrobia subdivision 3 bacterium]|nr:ECF RNA polymerase sigma factor SigW [Limisphaerales bacterium]MCS1417454.1 ECF RNA polymerase sigma factor SigW [Limisphaerales bacterium]